MKKMGIIFGSLIFVLAAVLAVFAVAGVQKSKSLQQEMKRMDRQINKMQKTSESLEEELEALKEAKRKETAGAGQEAGTAEDAQAADTREASDQKSNGRKVAIDPGHQGPGADTGGTEPLGPGSEEMKDKFASGTQGVYTGVPEYELTLAVSMQLQEELKNRGYEVIMTREDNDTAVSNVERAQIAAKNGAQILVRIHADGSGDNSANGAMTMIPSAENPYVGQLHEESSRLGEEIINAYCQATGIKNNGVRLYDNMTGINWSTVPVTILEMGFMTNQSDDERMQDPEMQKNMVQGIADGIDAYFAAAQ
ncbi:N-acetylmuramoyl-L-alanine amidase [Blautia pseudococcoides]|uniref:N-acetylmuramoyl-L-alanine amidase family protein n=1 Tax=Blautia pseudococcoides TaxID=1796616 RepID=UPI00148B10CD|nr:N-acetylmuramoyl-L-alanine amidase [Blautia pseudococcoides]MCR2018265.1 N-acetylmuramoyl-L-alanine amidase [Blautia pseudococcoides]QJU15847.1 N-acetylmuramoyl-L-alanine amidase [Blautia pseudococcoides]